MNPAINFVISDVGEFNDDAMHQVELQLTSVGVLEFAARKMTDSQDFLLTLNLSHVETSDFETIIMECFEMEGHLVKVTEVKLDSILAIKLESERDIDDLVIELQIKDIFKDQAGNTKDIKASIGNKNLSMVLVILNSHIGDDILYSDLSVIEGLVEVYRVKSVEFLELFFGKHGNLVEHMETIWSRGESEGIHKIAETLNDDRAIGHQAATNLKSERKFTILGKEECKTIAIDGEYASKKCELLQRLCRELTVGDCALTVNFDSKVVTITGKDFAMFQKCVNLIELQMKLFHCEEIKNMSKKLFNLLTENKKMKTHFTSILAENLLNSVVLLEDNLNRPAVLGLNKIKTRNFIEWFGRFFAKESIEMHHSHNKLGCKQLEASFRRLELNRMMSIDVTDDEIILQGLVTDVISIKPEVTNSLLAFKHILVEPHCLNYISKYGFEGVACQALLEGNCICLFKMNDDDERLVRTNPMRRATLYAPPVLYNVLKDSFEDLNTTVEKSLMTEIHYNYSSSLYLNHLKDKLSRLIKDNYQISTFCGDFDWPKTVAAVSSMDLIYEMNPRRTTVTIFSDKHVATHVKSILQGCLQTVKESEHVDELQNYHLQNHDFNKGLSLQTETLCEEFGIPQTTEYIKLEPIKPEPSRCMVS